VANCWEPKLFCEVIMFKDELEKQREERLLLIRFSFVSSVYRTSMTAPAPLPLALFLW